MMRTVRILPPRTTKAMPKSSVLKRFVSSSKSSFALFVCLLVLTFAYRIQLTIDLFTNPVRPFNFNPASYPPWLMLAYLPYDFALAIVCWLLSWFLSKGSKPFPILKVSGIAVLHILLIALALAYRAHLHLLFNVQTGLDFSIIREAFSSLSFPDIARLAAFNDYLFLLFPIGIFWLVLFFPPSLKIWIARISLGLAVLLSLAAFWVPSGRTDRVPPEVRLNPVFSLLSDAAHHLSSRQVVKNQKTSPITGEESGIQLTDSIDVHSMRAEKILPPASDHPWNIVFFIMESAGTRYLFDTTGGNPMPMPFLHRLSKESWHLKNHFTTSNVSTKAVFSLLSGLYDFFNRETFGIRPDARVPSIYGFLAGEYDRFLVTPSYLTWYFPAAFVKNSELKEIYSYENLNFKIKETFHSLGHYIARDEVETVDFFIRRLDNAKEPFVGIYMSFAAHFPYFDYGAEYHIREGDGDLMHRYYNNLNLLDHMIKRIYDHLEKRGMLERTIFVIVGDHGQAFGQHRPNNFMHYRYSYNENLETPAILHQPTLFRPKVFEFPTSHVDLLPTVLDALGIPYDPLLLDGESLFNRELRRKHIFFYGLEESISSLDTQQVKMQFSLRENRCWAFDLKTDPEEESPLDCSSYPLQLETLHGFASRHDSSLVQYNAAIIEKRDFKGRRHPSVKIIAK